MKSFILVIYLAKNIIKVMKSRRVRREGHVSPIERCIKILVFVGRHERKKERKKESTLKL
jgi:hypothetical protein